MNYPDLQNLTSLHDKVKKDQPIKPRERERERERLNYYRLEKGDGCER